MNKSGCLLHITNYTSALKFSEIAVHRNPGIHIKYIHSYSIKTQTMEITIFLLH